MQMLVSKVVTDPASRFGVVTGQTSILQKFFNPTAARGKTVWPKSPADLLRYGVRWDYDGVVTHNGKECHKFQLQPNAGKIPSTIRAWRDNNGGTHAVMGTMFIEQGVPIDKDTFKTAMEDCIKDI
ncbi:hypothetical protein FQN50_004039 [Emmonsiellopsis sp. PD_5]|nr:hypothetical protein FQN50_004039 [Emmonsiellopsis sp. PD_5]